ncbi:ABC-2 transporter permease [Phosphitispora sp. TUW77]|uniref:ABC-2 transporter permease n=1 Tax=Phosphitispora sp. TUW77 TaxID=3152361 RepID=UPI003AB8D036
MLNLVLKDILIQKKSFLVAVVYSGFLFIIFSNEVFKDAIYVMGTGAIAYIMIVTSSAYDDKYKSEIIINSLPVHRKSVVLAKYLAAVAFSAVGLIIVGALGLVIIIAGIPLPVRHINLYDIVFAFFSVALLAALYYPVYFKFGYNISRMLNLVLFMVLFFGPGALLDYIRQKMDYTSAQQLASRLQDIPAWAPGTLALAVAVLLTVVSLIISLKIYETKDF